MFSNTLFLLGLGVANTQIFQGSRSSIHIACSQDSCNVRYLKTSSIHQVAVLLIARDIDFVRSPPVADSAALQHEAPVIERLCSMPPASS